MDQVREWAKEANYLKNRIRRTIFAAAVFSAFLTTFLVFFYVALTGGEDRQLAHRVDEGVQTIILELRRDHDEIRCLLQTDPKDRSTLTFDRCFRRITEGGE